MLMLWEDLMPGDVVRFTKEVEEFYKISYNWWVKLWCCNKDLEVKKVLYMANKFMISICNGYENINIHIKLDGSDYNWSLYNYHPILQVFNIVSLKEDEDEKDYR